MQLSDRLAGVSPVLIDGGLSTALEDLGHDLSDSLWSARLLADDPDGLVEAHRAFVEAGAEVLITASYQASIPGLMARGYAAEEAETLIRLSTDLARRAAGGRALVAASVGPYGAYLADGSEYTGDYRMSVSELTAWHARRFEVLVESEPDLLAVETIPGVAEARALAPLLAGSGVEAWVSFTCGPGGLTRTGEDVAAAVAVVSDLEHVVAVGVNCTHPDDVDAALFRLRAGTDLPLVLYPNLGRAWDSAARRWTGDGSTWVDSGAVERWLQAGVRVIGGCCGTAPADIARLRRHLDRPT
jgi:homocysteine S-methyltransferase